MAITTNISIKSSANAGMPAGYTPSTLTPLADPVREQPTIFLAVSGIENADVPTALTALEAALLPELNSNYYQNVLGLDALLTITSNVTVNTIKRVRQVSNDFNPGAEFYEVLADVSYKVA